MARTTAERQAAYRARHFKDVEGALALVDVRVLDHFIVGSENVLSFAECGLI